MTPVWLTETPQVGGGLLGQLDKGAKNMSELEARAKQFDQGLQTVFKNKQIGELAALNLSK